MEAIKIKINRNITIDKNETTIVTETLRFKQTIKQTKMRRTNKQTNKQTNKHNKKHKQIKKAITKLTRPLEKIPKTVKKHNQDTTTERHIQLTK